jgi:Na+-transporting NADH:ubiquinone oxidoreductase subunit A
MSKDIRIKKGLSISLKGEAEMRTESAKESQTFKVRLDDFHGLTPKLIHKENAQVSKGEPLFFDKNNEEILFVSPVSGTVTEIERGARRRVLNISIEADGKNNCVDHKAFDFSGKNAEDVKQHLLKSGCWPYIKQRPYDVIARPDQNPKAVFISAFNSGPLQPNLEYILKGNEDKIQAAIDALNILTPGKVHVSVPNKEGSVFEAIKNIDLHAVSGPHPAGLVGTQIGQIDPINKGEVVWTIGAQDLLVIGELLLTGKYNPERIVAVTGSSINEPMYVRTNYGASLENTIESCGLKEGNHRLINGDVLTGYTSEMDGAIGFYTTQITAIPEGDDYEFFGWNKPVFDKISSTRAFTFSWLTPKKKYDLTTNTNGEHRAFVVTGSYEKVFPLDIYPMQLLKACMVKDLDEMEQLGLYEVAPEDFALTEFICISKQPHQQIIREGLDLLLKEIG